MADQLKFKLSSDVQKAVSDINKVVKKQGELIAKLRETNREGKKSKATFGALTGTFARFATVGGLATTAVVALKSAFSELDQIATKAAAKISQIEGDLKSLVQISNSAGENKNLEALTKSISVSTGLPQGQAAKIVQRGVSLGLSQKDIAELSRSFAFEQDPLALIESVGDVRGVVGQRPPLEIANALLAGQGPTKLGAAELSRLALPVTVLAKELGGTLAEAVAATAVGVIGSGKPETGAKQVEGFLGKLLLDKKQRFAGLGVAGAIQKFLSLPEKEQGAILGEQKEARIFAAKIRRNPERFTRQLTAVQGAIADTGTKDSLFNRNLRIAQANPRLAATNAREKAAQRLAIAEEPFGTQENIQDAVKDEIKRQLIVRGEGAGNRLLAAGSLALDDFLNADPRGVIAASSAFVSGGAENQADFRREMFGFLKTIAENTAPNRGTQLVRTGEVE